MQAWQDGCRLGRTDAGEDLQDAVGKKKFETTLKKYRL